MSSLEDRIKKAVGEHIEIVPYDEKWITMFIAEKNFLTGYLPADIVKRIEHFGSTAVPGLSAKPVIDMLAEVTSLEETKKRIVPLMEKAGYEYFWRPAFDDGKPPYYAWFIKRNDSGIRTHHIHMAEKNSELRERLLFRDYLIEFPDSAREYEMLKLKLAKDHPHDRIAYTKGKTGFIRKITGLAKEYYNKMKKDQNEN